ncbi:MAG: hypothetical protein JSW71_05025 [Gemmatimonadota bacterium]|nr:MAG: hypothetical protein JSW71_05025 [Gemmatimonadota bacterium]
MASLTEVKGIVVVVEGRVDLALRQVARTHHLSILKAPSARVAYRAVLCLHPRLIIVQVSHVTGEALEFIRLVINSAAPAPLLAVATTHTDKIERAARNAGAAWYLDNASSPVVDEVLARLMSRES